MGYLAILPIPYLNIIISSNVIAHDVFYQGLSIYHFNLNDYTKHIVVTFDAMVGKLFFVFISLASCHGGLAPVASEYRLKI